MVRVFISYSDEIHGKKGNRWVQQLETCLRDINTMNIEPILAANVRGAAVEIAERVANEIEKSHLFVTFYTEEARKQTAWLDQELGYAFRVARSNGLKIIPFWKGDLEEYNKMAFLSSKIVHFDKRFQLNENPTETFDELRKYLMEEYRHPIELDLKLNDKFIPNPTAKEIPVVLTITNKSPGIIKDAYLDFVLPKIPNKQNDIRVIPIPGEKKAILKKEVQEHWNTYITSNIPDNFRYHVYRRDGRQHKEDRFVINKGIEIIRYHFPLDELHSTAYESSWDFRIHGENYNEFDFCVYLYTSKFGPIYYWGQLFTFKEEGNFALKDIGISIGIRQTTVDKRAFILRNELKQQKTTAKTHRE